jgi:AraC-like DNA-binding protein
MNLVVAGSATFGIGDVVIQARAGDLLAFPPGQDHALLEASSDLYLYAIGMDPAFSSEVLRADRHSTAFPLRVQLPVTDFEALATRAADVVDRTRVEQRGAELWERAHWLGRRCQGRSSAAMHVLTRRTLQVVSEEPELGLESVARKLRATPSEVSRYFHRDVGMTLVRYRTRLRLINLIRLVDAGNYNLMTSAGEAGFGSYSQCHRIFQSELGCAPRQFFMSGVREQMQGAYMPLSS